MELRLQLLGSGLVHGALEGEETVNQPMGTQQLTLNSSRSLLDIVSRSPSIADRLEGKRNGHYHIIFHEIKLVGMAKLVMR